MRLFLIRHPRPAIAAGLCYGQSDLALGEPSVNAHARIAPLLPVDAVLYSSPLRRCAELARELGATPVFDDRLREMAFGEWELRAWDDIPRTDLDRWAADPAGFVPPGGESAKDMAARVIAFAREMLAALTAPDAPENVVIVTHQGPMRVLFAALLGLPESAWLNLHFEYAAVSQIEITKTMDAAQKMGTREGLASEGNCHARLLYQNRIAAPATPENRAEESAGKHHRS